jgi:hypothetical protein
MCEYVNDDGEQCGRTNHDGDYCWQHEDATDAADDASSVIEMDATCSDCGGSLRRTERLKAHENLGSQMMFVALVECECSEHVLGTQPVSIGNMPGGWL